MALVIQILKTYFKHLKETGKNLGKYSSKCDFILLGDLNSEPTESVVRDFCEIYSSKNPIKGRIR